MAIRFVDVCHNVEKACPCRLWKHCGVGHVQMSQILLCVVGPNLGIVVVNVDVIETEGDQEADVAKVVDDLLGPLSALVVVIVKEVVGSGTWAAKVNLQLFEMQVQDGTATVVEDVRRQPDFPDKQPHVLLRLGKANVGQLPSNEINLADRNVALEPVADIL